jgi:sporulation integral membrane protein YtvI
MKEKYVLDNHKFKRLCFIVIALVIGLFLVYKSAYYLLPFIIAFALSSLMEPLIRLLITKAKIPRKLSAAISLVVVLIVLGYLVTAIVTKVVGEIKALVSSSPQFINDVYQNIVNLSNRSNDLLISVPEELTLYIGSIVESLFKSVSSILNSLLDQVLSFAISLPSALIFFLITILSTYFMSSGRREIGTALKSQLPEDWYEKILTIRNEVFLSLFQLIKAYLIIMSITFTEILIGFSVMGLKYSLILAFLICIVDILPVLGTGTVLIPWSVYSFLTGDTKMGIFLVIMYVVILIIRQVIEPKIVGQQIGVHPLLTLMAIYIGLKIFGAIGLMLGPIIMLIIKNTLSVLFRGKSIFDILFKTSDSV